MAVVRRRVAQARSSRAVGATDHGARLGGRERQSIHRRFGPVLIRLGQAMLDGVGSLGHLPGADGPGRALQAVSRIEPRLRIGASVDGAQMLDALLGEEREQLTLERMVAAGLAREMRGIDSRLGHGANSDNA